MREIYLCSKHLIEFYLDRLESNKARRESLEAANEARKSQDFQKHQEMLDHATKSKSEIQTNTSTISHESLDKTMEAAHVRKEALEKAEQSGREKFFERLNEKLNQAEERKEHLYEQKVKGGY